MSLEFTQDFLDRLKRAERLVFFTGAGISAESGIPTFRGKDGIWNKMRPEELASIDGFMKNPELVWEWYQHRRKIVNETQPHDGHKAISALEELYDVTVVTQNVDNLHRRAGSRRIYELHGNLTRNFCMDCRTEFAESEIEYGSKVMRCKCGGMIRPDVVWFGEMLPQDEFLASEQAARDCDILFVVGTSAVVYPAAYIPIGAKQEGGYLAEVNIEPTDATRIMDVSFFGTAGEVLPQILAKARELKKSA